MNQTRDNMRLDLPGDSDTPTEASLVHCPIRKLAPIKESVVAIVAAGDFARSGALGA